MIDYKIIKELRTKNKCTQSKLASKLGVSRSAVSMWEIGNSEPDNDMLVKIAELFNVSTDYLLGRPEQKQNDNITFDDFTYAMYNESKELTEDQKEMLLDMAKTFKNKLKKDGKI